MKKSQVYLLICLALMLFGGCSSEQTSGYVSKGADYAKQPTTTVVRTTVTTDPLVGDRTSFKDMRVGDIGKKGNIYVSLNYVKRMDALPTGWGPEEPNEGNEVIVGFFEFLNASNGLKEIDHSEITCYVDGVQVSDVDTFIKVHVDGVEQQHGKSIDSGFQLLTCEDFEVPKGWKEIKFFYSSDCIWTVSSDEVTNEPYNKQMSITNQRAFKVTNEGEVIYSKDYTVEYLGYEMYNYNNYISGYEDYAVFKFRISNNTDKTLDYSSVGYNMRAYQNNIFMGDSDGITDKKFGTCISVYYVDKIEPGFKSDVFIAFRAEDVSSDFCMIYDDGFINEHYCGFVYIKHE